MLFWILYVELVEGVEGCFFLLDGWEVEVEGIDNVCFMWIVFEVNLFMFFKVFIVVWYLVDND